MSDAPLTYMVAMSSAKQAKQYDPHIQNITFIRKDSQRWWKG